MKIAIKGHESRGREIIRILESLGTEDILDHTGSNKNWYYIRNDSLCPKRLIITSADETFLKNYGYSVYTLEEFEKEFPFKIGDKVFLGEDNEYLYTIKSISIWHDGDIVYELAENELHYTANQLTLYKEMKEERNITLTLEKAKEWYNKGGELKEVALQAFSEEELNRVNLPKTWEEFCNNYPVKETEAVICCDSTIADCSGLGKKRDSEIYKDICPSKKSAGAHLAMIQLEQLRNCWWNGWEPIWDISQKWCIRLFNGAPSVGITINISKFLTFPTKEMAEEFLECFRDLIEKAEDLI